MKQPNPATDLIRSGYATLRLTAFVLLCLISAHVKGQFASFSPIVKEESTSGMVVGDLDNDGGQDVVVFPSDSIRVYHKVSIGGPYAVEVLPTLGGYGRLVDVDEDGLLDIAVGNGPALPFNWLRNLGTSFSSTVQQGTSIGIPSITAIAFADMDGDGDTDVLYRGTSSGDIIIKYRDSSNQFVQPTTITYAGYFTVLAIHPMDLDNDGDMDIVISGRDYSGTAKNWVYVNTGGQIFTLNQTLTNPLDEQPVLVDVDSDGHMDLALRRTWSRNMADGTFAAWVNFTMNGAALTLSQLAERVYTDINNDGFLDLLYGDLESIMVAMGNGIGAFTPAQVLTALTYNSGSSQTISMMVTLENGSAALFVNQAQRGRITRYAISGTGQTVLTDLVSESVRTTAQQTVDLNGDGRMDLAYLSGDEGFILGCINNGTTFNRSTILFQIPERLFSFEFADMDLDGDLDVVVTLSSGGRIYRNNGNGTFASMGSLFGSYWSTCSWVDMNGDGYLDVVMWGVPQGTLLPIFRNNAGVSFSRFTPFSADVSGVWGVGDYNQDGIMDMFVTYIVEGTFWARGLGNFSYATPTALSISRGLLRKIDMNNDGKDDLVSIGNKISWRRRTGVGTAYAAEQDLVPDNTYAGILSVFDIDGDGSQDVLRLRTHNFGSNEWYRNVGSGVLDGPYPLSVSDMLANQTVLHIADMDNDGALDVVCRFSSISLLKNLLIYRMSGTVFADLDGNGVQDALDPGIALASILTNPLGYVSYSDTMGSFTVHCGPGANSIGAHLPSPYWAQSTVPITHTAALDQSLPVIDDLDFGFAPLVDTSVIDLGAVLSPAACGEVTSYWLRYKNIGTRIERGTVRAFIDPSFTIVGTVPAATILPGNGREWQFDSLDYFQVGLVKVLVQRPGVALIGTQLITHMEVNTFDEFGVSTGVFELSDTLIHACAYDPNDKMVLPKGYGASGAIDIDTPYLDYTIRFQNTGTAPAFDVELRDQLGYGLRGDRVELTGYSHMPGSVAIEQGGRLVIRFNNIMLPDSASDPAGSQGFVSLRIHLIDNLPHLTQITNTAEIYFDLNPPIITNSTITTLVDCDLWHPQILPLTETVLEATLGDSYQWFLNGEVLADTTRTLIVGSSGEYSAMVTSQYGCVALSPTYHVISTDVIEHNEARFAIVPNPLATTARIICSIALTAQDRIDLFDTNGSLLRTGSGNGTQETILQRGELAPAVYFVRITRDGRLLGALPLVVE